MTILLLRHASAGSRDLWQGEDALRPLDEEGRRQAALLASDLAGRGVQRIVSSPCRRCVETVEPLAALLSLPIERRSEVAVDAAAEQSLDLLRELDARTTLVCTHREVIAPLVGDDRRTPMGAAWILELDGEVLVPAGFLPQP
jgi:8-oxo-dGTP diphosphatase